MRASSRPVAIRTRHGRSLLSSSSPSKKSLGGSVAAARPGEDDAAHRVHTLVSLHGGLSPLGLACTGGVLSFELKRSAAMRAAGRVWLGGMLLMLFTPTPATATIGRSRVAQHAVSLHPCPPGSNRARHWAVYGVWCLVACWVHAAEARSGRLGWFPSWHVSSGRSLGLHGYSWAEQMHGADPLDPCSSPVVACLTTWRLWTVWGHLLLQGCIPWSGPHG